MHIYMNICACVPVYIHMYVCMYVHVCIHDKSYVCALICWLTEAISAQA